MPNPYTKKGRQEKAALARSEAGVVRVTQEHNGTLTLTVDVNAAPIPERTYRAATVHHVVGPDRVARFLFGQFRGLALQHLQSAVVIEIPLSSVRRIAESAVGSPLEQAALRTDLGAVAPMPSAIVEGREEPEQTVTYGAQLARMSVNPEFGGAIDFFEVPVHHPQMLQVFGVIRIACSNAVVLDFLNRCREVAGAGS